MAEIAKMYTLTLFCLLILAMAIIIFVVYRNEQKMIPDVGQVPPRLKRTRLIVRQAIMYILAFFLTWIFFVIPWNSNSPEYVDVLESILVPLGGFWNMLIFVYSKICLLREVNTDVDSNFSAFLLLLKDPDSVPEVILSGIENVEIDDRITDDEPEVDEESHYTSHPSAYDGLSAQTPSIGQEALSPGSLIVHFSPSDEKKIYKNYADVAARYKCGQANCDSISSSRYDDMSSTGLSFNEKNASALPSLKTPSTVDSKRLESWSKLSSGERLYKNFADVAARHKCGEDDIGSIPSDSHFDDVSRTGISFDEKNETKRSTKNAMCHCEKVDELSESLSYGVSSAGE